MTLQEFESLKKDDKVYSNLFGSIVPDTFSRIVLKDSVKFIEFQKVPFTKSNVTLRYFIENYELNPELVNAREVNKTLLFLTKRLKIAEESVVYEKERLNKFQNSKDYVDARIIHPELFV